MDHRRRLEAILLVGLVVSLSSLACSIGRGVDRDLPRATVPVATEAPVTPTVAVATATLAQEVPTSTAQPVAPTPTAPPSPTHTPIPTSPPVEPARPPETADSAQGPLDVAQIPELKVTTLDPRGMSRTQMDTFRQRMTAEFYAAESAYNGVYHYEAEVNTSAQAVHVIASAEGGVAKQLPANQVEAIWIGTRLWVKVGNRPWMPVPEEVSEAQFDQQTVSVGAFLPYVPYFDRVQPDETINGIVCVHYAYDAQDLHAEYGTVDARGHIWVAQEGGYVMRYTLEAVGTFEQYFKGPGTLKLTYDTFDVGADIQIVPPHVLGG